LYELALKSFVKKDFKKINKADITFIRVSLYQFIEAFSPAYEEELFKLGKIKKLEGESEDIYRLKLRRYRVIYKKKNIN